MGTISVHATDSTGRRWKLTEVSSIARKLKLPGVTVSSHDFFYQFHFSQPVNFTFTQLSDKIESYGLEPIMRRP